MIKKSKIVQFQMSSYPPLYKKWITNTHNWDFKLIKTLPISIKIIIYLFYKWQTSKVVSCGENPIYSVFVRKICASCSGQNVIFGLQYLLGYHHTAGVDSIFGRFFHFCWKQHFLQLHLQSQILSFEVVHSLQLLLVKLLVWFK